MQMLCSSICIVPPLRSTPGPGLFNRVIASSNVRYSVLKIAFPCQLQYGQKGCQSLLKGPLQWQGFHCLQLHFAQSRKISFFGWHEAALNTDRLLLQVPATPVVTFQPISIYTPIQTGGCHLHLQKSFSLTHGKIRLCHSTYCVPESSNTAILIDVHICTAISIIACLLVLWNVMQVEFCVGQHRPAVPLVSMVWGQETGELSGRHMPCTCNVCLPSWL